MKKLRIEDLQVDSFVTSIGGTIRGTVEGMNDTNSVYTACNTCGIGCTGDCDATGYSGCGDTMNCTQAGATCGADGSCAPGETRCGTCYPDYTCDLQWPCGGYSFDLQPC